MLNPNIYERKPEINEANLQIEIEYLLTKHKDKLEDNQVEKRLRDLKNDIDKDITILQYCESTFKRYFLDAELKRNLIFLSNLVQEKADSSQKNIFVEEINANLLSRLLEDFKGDELHINAGITRFPEKVLVQYPEKMKELKSIIIEGLNECNKLIDFPSTLCKLSMLESLTLTHHSFKHIPDEINQLNNLKSLNLSNNELIYINPQIGKLTQLTSLKLNKNILSGRLPLDIVNCVNLGSLDIDDNLFDYLPPLEGLSKLDTLRVRNNNLRAFPNVFSDDNHLETLDISFNKICSISDGILHLTHLKHLNASGNQITNISPSIKNLVQLETLDLQTNFLTDLPPEIGQLKKLCFLSLNDNRIRSLTPAVGQLKNLKWLYLEKKSIIHTS